MVFQMLRKLHGKRRNLQNAGNAEGDGEDIFGKQQRYVPNSPGTAPPNLQASTTIMKALSDDESDMSKFLFASKSRDAITPLNYCCAAHAMSLQPLDVRTDRIIMLFEAYTIFGALFSAATWSIYEWGLTKYGDTTDPDYVIQLRRGFEFFMAISLACNIIMALYGSLCWIHSIMYSASRVNYVYEARRVVSGLQLSLQINMSAVMFGLIIGLILKLDPESRDLVGSSVSGWIEFGIAMATFLYVAFKLGLAQNDFFLATIPLEMYHTSAMYRSKELKQRAFERAKELEASAYEERMKIDPNASHESDSPTTLGTLLHVAAANLELPDVDTSSYEVRLNRELIFEEKHLRGMDLESLARYLPFRLAKEVHCLLSLTKYYDCNEISDSVDMKRVESGDV